MKQFYKVRVVEDRVKKSFTVQVKHHWLSPWQFWREVTASYCNSEQKARELAIELADRLMQSQVIYEVK